MKIILIGATGFVGSHILTEALNRGHEVHAIVRALNKLQIKNENLSPIKADVMEENELQDIFNSGYDAVISAYNPGWSNPNIYEDFTIGYTSILNALKSSEIKRLIVIGGAGSLEIDGKKLIESPDFPKEFYEGAKAASNLLDVLRTEISLDWTFVSPAINLLDGERTGNFKLGLGSPVYDENGKSKVSVQDLAVAVIDELENPEHIKKRFTLGS